MRNAILFLAAPGHAFVRSEGEASLTMSCGDACTDDWMCDMAGDPFSCDGCAVCNYEQHLAAHTKKCSIAFQSVEAEGEQVLPSVNDGNCLFYSVARLLGERCSEAGLCEGNRDLRALTVGRMRSHPDDFQALPDNEPVEPYTRRMAMDRSHAGFDEAQALSSALGVPLKVVYVDGPADAPRVEGFTAEPQGLEGPPAGPLGQLLFCDSHWVAAVPRGWHPPAPMWRAAPARPVASEEGPAPLPTLHQELPAPVVVASTVALPPAKLGKACTCGEAQTERAKSACCEEGLTCSGTEKTCKPGLSFTGGLGGRCHALEQCSTTPAVSPDTIFVGGFFYEPRKITCSGWGPFPGTCCMKKAGVLEEGEGPLC